MLLILIICFILLCISISIIGRYLEKNRDFDYVDYICRIEYIENMISKNRYSRKYPPRY